MQAARTVSDRSVTIPQTTAAAARLELEVLKLRRAAAYFEARALYHETLRYEEQAEVRLDLVRKVRAALAGGGDVEKVLASAEAAASPNNDNIAYCHRPFLAKALERFDAADDAVEEAGGASLTDLGTDTCDPMLGAPVSETYLDDVELFGEEAKRSTNGEPVDQVALYVEFADLDERMRARGRSYYSVVSEPESARETLAKGDRR